jgi:hypothetical protein
MTRPFDPQDKPLDEVQAQVVRRVRRLVIFSSILMMGGVLLVLGVIAYRLSADGRAAAPADVRVSLPTGARVISTAVADGRLAVTIETAGAVEVWLFDLRTLEPRGRLQLAPTP